MKDKIKYYLLLLAFLFIMALILWFFHDWIEQYSNSLMVLITFIYVVATIEICRTNIKSAEATKEQLEESKRQFAENERLQMMPYFEIIVHDDIRDFVECIGLRFLYNGIIIKHQKTEPTYTKTSLFLCEKRRFFMARREKGVVPIIYFEKERGKSF